MSRTQNPEIPRKLIDALIRTVIEQGFSPGIDDVAERAGVSKTIALAQYPTRTGLTVAALERVGRETIKNLEAAINRPDIPGSPFDCDINRVVDCLAGQLTDRGNPAGFITMCLAGHPDPRSKARAAAMKEHAAVTRWLENFFRIRRAMPRPDKAANALMALVHGTYAVLLGSGIDAWKPIAETATLMRYILAACWREKTAVPYVPKRKASRAREGRKRVPTDPDPAAALPPEDP